MGANAVLVVIDPITCFLDSGVNTNNDASVRTALLPLAEVAATTSAAINVVRHLNKDVDKRAVYRGGGSIGFTAAARSVIVLGENPSQRESFVFTRVKANLVARADMPSLGYRLVPSEEDLAVPVVEWDDEPIDVTADDLHARHDSRLHAPRRAEAEDFLQIVLRDGKWHNAGELKHDAKTRGINPKTLERAANKLDVERGNDRSDTGQFSGWLWRLPTAEPSARAADA